jgi:hypothetical protein
MAITARLISYSDLFASRSCAAACGRGARLDGHQTAIRATAGRSGGAAARTAAIADARAMRAAAIRRRVGGGAS